MTKQEQIEEMANDIEYAIDNECKLNNGKSCEDCVFDNKGDWYCQSLMTATHLYAEGYRKIDKDSVVLSREEYEKVDKEIINKSTYDTIWKAGYNAYEKTIGECVAEARKETAEKYHKAMRKVIHERDYIGGYAEIGLQEENDEIAKQFGVEIKE